MSLLWFFPSSLSSRFEIPTIMHTWLSNLIVKMRYETASPAWSHVLQYIVHMRAVIEGRPYIKPAHTHVLLKNEISVRLPRYVFGRMPIQRGDTRA